MSNIFFSSDWHLYHKNIKLFCPLTRKGESLQDMVDIILNNISEQMNPGDILYNIGDVSFGTREQTFNAMEIISTKMGIQHHLVMGNHDKVIRSDSKIQSMFKSVQDKIIINQGKKQIVLSHIPFASNQWDSAHYGSYHFYGHTHGSFKLPGRCFDVGIDTRPEGDMKMWSYEELDAMMSAIPVIKEHHR
jgi:calcineurin-like phosphoesterase family protein